MKTIKKNMEHSFNIAIAKEYGVLAAVLIRNFQYWISKNKSEKHNFVNGHYWTFNSTAGLCELFPYMSKDQINRQINMLVEKGVLIKGHFSENPNDRRTWIAFSDDAKWISQNYEMDLAISQNGFSESAKCINEYYNDTNNKHTDNKPNNKPECKPRVYEAEKFAPLNANDVAFADFYRRTFNTDFIWQENTSQSVQRIIDSIENTIRANGDIPDPATMPQYLTDFLNAVYRLNDKWLNERFNPQLIAKQYNQLYNRISNGAKSKQQDELEAYAKAAGVSPEFLAEVAAGLGGSL